MAYVNSLDSPQTKRVNSSTSHQEKDASILPSDNSITPQAVEGSQHPPPSQGHQRLVFTDPIAFRYLEEDQSTVVLERERTLSGYEIYIVEQWACSRVHPTFVINTYTGDQSHTAVVGVLSVPTDERNWSSRLKTYFDAVTQFHARKRDTPLGTLMVTNLSSFPSSLALIPVPEGNVKSHREDFVVSENLKRLGCAGRAGLNLRRPAADTQAKFHQVYKTSEKVPFYTAVQELVKLCQTALSLFGKLAPEYVDGLLCDVTERAISDWWTDIGTDFFNIEPSDGILGPTTVAALLGTLLGARNRLHASGAPVAKDAFDVYYFKKGIGSFQKAHRIDKTRKLDRQTLEKLHRVTAKAASGDGWAVPRAVKSTVAELGGKGGEMVMGMVAGRDKAGISEVETLDIDRFVKLATGERYKWLWRGKPPKAPGDVFQDDSDDDDEMVFTHDDRGGYVWARRKRELAGDCPSTRPSLELESPWKQTESPVVFDDGEQIRLGLKKSVTNKVSDARAGLGRFRDVVGFPGLRSHHRRHSKESVDLDASLAYQQLPEGGIARQDTKDSSDGGYFMENTPASAIESQIVSTKDQCEPTSAVGAEASYSAIPADSSQKQDASLNRITEDAEEAQNQPGDPAVVGLEVPSEGSGEQTKPTQVDEPVLVTRVLHRAQSFIDLSPETCTKPKDARWPRHLSFSAVEDSVLLWNDVGELATLAEDAKPLDAILHEDILAADVRAIGNKIACLGETTGSWVEGKVSAVEHIQLTAQSRLEELNLVYQEKYEEYQGLRADSSELMTREEAAILDNAKQVEVLGAKLDYELNVLQSRIEEVENGLVDYERHILGIEERVQSLMKDEEKKSGTSWLAWGFQLLKIRS